MSEENQIPEQLNSIIESTVKERFTSGNVVVFVGELANHKFNEKVLASIGFPYLALECEADGTVDGDDAYLYVYFIHYESNEVYRQFFTQQLIRILDSDHFYVYKEGLFFCNYAKVRSESTDDSS